MVPDDVSPSRSWHQADKPAEPEVRHQRGAEVGHYSASLIDGEHKNGISVII